MRKKGYTFWILVISWVCFVIGCGVTVAYLNISSGYQSQDSSTETVQAMQRIEQNEVDADALTFASIKSFMNIYYECLKEGKREELTKMVADPESFYSDAELGKMKAYVEDYRQIHCYIEDSMYSDCYIVFVSYETKIYDIETLVPGISQYYLKKNDDSWIIFNNTKQLSKSRQNEIKASLRLKKIKTLIEDTNQKYEQAIASNQSLQQYFKE